ncbi:hypothetical protein CHS0354_037606 [Potamilus streckersoni]|uniref:Uncharacterized protein n=1 Tax=Potamilus streckersoni TaxID=2493646 RepID=A0AAE0RY90_9BIVA|nr:hypothetical protein CHS0354_037606 [Potamilus streckersoni]
MKNPLLVYDELTGKDKYTHLPSGCFPGGSEIKIHQSSPVRQITVVDESSYLSQQPSGGNLMQKPLFSADKTPAV